MTKEEEAKAIAELDAHYPNHPESIQGWIKAVSLNHIVDPAIRELVNYIIKISNTTAIERYNAAGVYAEKEKIKEQYLDLLDQSREMLSVQGQGFEHLSLLAKAQMEGVDVRLRSLDYKSKKANA